MMSTKSNQQILGLRASGDSDRNIRFVLQKSVEDASVDVNGSLRRISQNGVDPSEDDRVGFSGSVVEVDPEKRNSEFGSVGEPGKSRNGFIRQTGCES